MVDPRDLVTLSVTVVVELRDEQARAVAEEALEITGRDLQLKMMLLADALVSATITMKVGRHGGFTRTLTGDSLASFLLKE